MDQLPALTAGVMNQGLAYYVPREGATVLKNVISVSANGTNSGVMYYQPKEFTVLQDSYAIKYRSEQITSRHYLYLVAALQKSIKGKYNWSNKAGWEKIKKESIKLPVSPNQSLAFDYIEKYIKIIELADINILKIYMKSNGLNDVELTKEEVISLKLLDGSKEQGINWRSFNITDLFKIKNTHCILSREVIPNSGDTPYLTASRHNNSVGTYINYDKTKIDKGNSIFIGGKTFVVTYQKNDYFSNDSHNLSLYCKDKLGQQRENQLFYISSIRKGLGHLYSWGNSISKTKIQKDKIYLPVDKNNLPDYNYMATLIRATQKIILKDLVTWINKFDE
ncbi:restriction endonuclease subunit M [Lactococcus lactis subsp. lactis KLDS 4.0325]|nr:restriction endonuclease subunit M [Lactococcus lactis subsp. lactis KLDS 4.0325]